MVDVVLRVLQVAKPLLVVKAVVDVEHCAQVVAAIVVMAPVAVVASVLVVIPAPLVVTLLVIILAPALVIALVLQVAQMIVPVLALAVVKVVLLHVKMIVLVTASTLAFQTRRPFCTFIQTTLPWKAAAHMSS